MPASGSWKPAWYALLPIVVFFLAWWGYLHALPYVQLPYDDCYIAQQYARHLLRTGVLTFDGTMPSRGATSPPHVFFLSVCRQVISDPVTVALLVGFVCHTGFLVVLFLLVRELGCRPSVAVAVVCAAASCGFLVVDSVNGLETSFFHFLATALVLTALRVRDSKGLILLTPVVWLACWCRPEGVLLVGIFLLVFGWRLRDKGLLKRENWIAIALLLLGPVLVLVGHFSPGQVPSWRIKMVFYGQADLPLAEKIRIGARGIVTFMYFLRWYLVIPVGAVILRFLLRFSTRLGTQPASDPVPFARFPGWVSVVIFVFIGTFYAGYIWCLPSSLQFLDFRYQHVLLPWVFVATAWGFQVLISYVYSGRMRRVVFSFLLISLILGSVMTYVSSRRVYAICARSVQNVLIPLASQLCRIAGPEDVIASHDVGVLGYYSGRPIVDLVGLTDPLGQVVLQESADTARDKVLRAGRGFLVVHRSWDELCLHIDPDAQTKEFRYLFQTEPGFGDRYRVYRFGY